MQGEDINFYVQKPDGGELYRVTNEKKGFHQIVKSNLENIGVDGNEKYKMHTNMFYIFYFIKLDDFKLCLDNTYSTFTHKLVYLYVLSYNIDDMRLRHQAQKSYNISSESIVVIKL